MQIGYHGGDAFQFYLGTMYLLQQIFFVPPKIYIYVETTPQDTHTLLFFRFPQYDYIIILRYNILLH